VPGPGDKRVRADFLLRSKDLAKWEYLHPLVEYDPYTLVAMMGRARTSGRSATGTSSCTSAT